MLSGIGTHQIADELNARKVPTKKGGKWTASTVRGMIYNEKYVGDVIFQKIYTDEHFNRHTNYGEKDQYLMQCHHEPIISREDIERYKVVKRVVDDFIGDLNLNIPGLGKKLLSIWHEEVFENGTKKDAAIQLKKKDLIWPIMVVATDVGYCDNSFADIFDSSAYDEIVRQYRETIESCCERCEFFIKVLCDYNTYQTTKKPSEKCLDFVMNKWRDYLLEFELDGMDEEIQKGLIQIILYRIVRNRIVIQNIKKGVKL